MTALTVPWLHCTGTQILDEYNNPYYLRGTNTWLDVGSPPTVDLTYDDLEDMQRWGFNVVRMFVLWRWFTPTDENFETTRFTTADDSWGPALDDVVDWCEELDMYWMPTFEYHNFGSQWYPPSWTDLTEEHATSRNYWTGALVTNSSIASPPNNYTLTREGWRNMWAGIADRLKSSPNLIIDLWNEPNSSQAGNYGGLANFYSDWTTFLNEVIVDIRAAETTNHLITITELTPNCYETNGDCWSDVTGSDIVWNRHRYPLDNQNYNEPYPGDDYEFLKTKYDFNMFHEECISRYGRPVMMSEVGRRTYPSQAGGDYDYTVDVFRAFDELGVVHWLWWNTSRRALTAELFNVLDTDGNPIETSDNPGHTFIEVIRENTYKNSASSKIADAFAMLSE